MRCHLRPYLHENGTDIRIGIGSYIKCVIVDDEIDMQVFSPANGRIEESKKQRIRYVVGVAAGHGVQVDRQPDDVATQRLDILKILFGKFCELNLARAGSLKPVGQIHAVCEFDLTPALQHTEEAHQEDNQ